MTLSSLKFWSAAFVLCLVLVVPAVARAEYIERFASDITIHDDAHIEVVETITYVFTTPRHGIERYIPLTHPERSPRSLSERVIEIVPEGVLMDGEPVPTEDMSGRSAWKARIGDPNTLIEGAHTYTIRYRVYGALSYPTGAGTELYWNVTGNDWTVPIRIAEATLYDPDELVMPVRACYYGTPEDSSGSCATRVATGTISFRATELKVGEGLTIAQALNPTKVARDTRERTRWLFLVVPIFAIGLLWGGYGLYRWKTAYRTDAPIIPQYEPYPGMKPMYTGLLMDGRLDPRDITACIVYLAERGYLKIRKTERTVLFLFEVDDYEISLVKMPDEAVSAFERGILEIIMDAPLALGKTTSLNELKRDRAEQRKNYKELNTLEAALHKDMVEEGFFEAHEGLVGDLVQIGVAGIAVALVLKVWATLSGATLAIGGVVWVLVFVIVVYGVVMHRRRTRVGYETLDYLKGFKLFLETTERDRYLFHNAPEKSPEQFMEYLPYAIAFGVEERWADVFAGIAIPNPDWYDGGSVGAFSSTSLTQSLGAFSTAFASSSGTSASSGGGHSGGGAGGGGGGSW